MSEGGFMLKPKSRGETEVAFYTNVDPQLSLPSSLLNMLSGQLIHTILSRMEHHSHKTIGADSAWAPLIAEHKCVYDDVRKAVDSFFINEAPVESTEEQKNAPEPETVTPASKKDKKDKKGKQ